MKLFYTNFSGKCKESGGQKSKNAAEEDRWRVDTEEEKQKEAWEDESQPLINLGLGIGRPNSWNPRRRPADDNREKDNNFDRNNMKVKVKMMMNSQDGIVFDDDDDDDDQMVEKVGCRKSSVVMFTEEQVEELKRQMLIYKYMVWGLPVPFQLLLPIWKSFSSSSSCVPPHFYFYKNSSLFLLGYSWSGFNRQQMMYLEPGRCRRTDGKKWRCQQSVVPNEKYCEKHMHRGSKRSRKLVEAPPKSRTHDFVNLIRNNNIVRDIRPKFQENLDQDGPTKVVVGAPGLTDTAAKSKNTKQIEAKRDIVVNERVAVVNRASGMDFSPRSVLQNDRGMKCPRVESSKNGQNLSESRCKRTDGKKWQCKKEVVPDRKYCAQHINRGKRRSAKPCLGSSACGFEAQAAAYGSTSVATISKTVQSKVGMSLDTNLKISLPARQADPRNTIRGSMARDDSGTSSTEATESDGSTDVSDTIVLSP